jgi:cell division septal protein FtsQ
MARRRTTERREQEEGSAYLRSKRPVRVRRGTAAWAWFAARWLVISLFVAGLALAAVQTVDHFLHTGSRFVLSRDGSGLEVSGLEYVREDEVRRVFETDFGGSLADVPLESRYRGLLEISWVWDARILRIWPDQIRVHVKERRPVAFARVKDERDTQVEVTRMLDRAGVFLEPPGRLPIDLPVVTGVHPSMPLAERRARVRLLESLVAELDGEEPRYSRQLSEIDLSDLENARVTTLYKGDVIELQMGNSHLRHRYEIFLKYIDTWRETYGAVGSVNLRFKGQVAVRRAAR